MARVVACLALVALLVVGAHAQKGASVTVTVSKGKGVAAADPAPVVVAATPAAVQPEPNCTEVCKDKCSVSFDKACKMVPMTTTECQLVKKTVTTKSCSKKCSIVAPPPAPAPAPTPAAPTAHTAEASGKGKTVTVVVSAAGKGGRKLAEANKVADTNAQDKADFLPLLLLAAKHAAGKGAKAPKPQVVCADVCEDVPVAVMDKECKEVTSEVEQCEIVPKQTCVKECACVMTKHGKGFAVMLPHFIKHGKGH